MSRLGRPARFRHKATFAAVVVSLALGATGCTSRVGIFLPFITGAVGAPEIAEEARALGVGARAVLAGCDCASATELCGVRARRDQARGRSAQRPAAERQRAQRRQPAGHDPRGGDLAPTSRDGPRRHPEAGRRTGRERGELDVVLPGRDVRLRESAQCHGRGCPSARHQGHERGHHQALRPPC